MRKVIFERKKFYLIFLFSSVHESKQQAAGMVAAFILVLGMFVFFNDKNFE